MPNTERQLRQTIDEQEVVQVMEYDYIERGDCLKLMKFLPDNSVNLTLTDIPYDGVNRSSNGLRVLDKSKGD